MENATGASCPPENKKSKKENLKLKVKKNLQVPENYEEEKQFITELPTTGEVSKIVRTKTAEGLNKYNTLGCIPRGDQSARGRIVTGVRPIEKRESAKSTRQKNSANFVIPSESVLKYDSLESSQENSLNWRVVSERLLDSATKGGFYFRSEALNLIIDNINHEMRLLNQNFIEPHVNTVGQKILRINLFNAGSALKYFQKIKKTKIQIDWSVSYVESWGLIQAEVNIEIIRRIEGYKIFLNTMTEYLKKYNKYVGETYRSFGSVLPCFKFFREYKEKGDALSKFISILCTHLENKIGPCKKHSNRVTKRPLKKQTSGLSKETGFFAPEKNARCGSKKTCSIF